MADKMTARFKKHLFNPCLEVSGLYTAFEVLHDEKYFFSGEYHDFWEMVYVMSDKVGVSSDDRIYSLCQGDIIFHKPMEFHRLWSVEGKKAHLFIMSFDLSGCLAPQFENLVVSLSQSCREYLGRIISEFSARSSNGFDSSIDGGNSSDNFQGWKPDGLHELRIKALLELFLSEILAEKSTNTHPLPHTSGSAEIYRKTVQLLRENVCGRITVEQIATKLSYSPAYIKRIFSKYSDIGIHSFYLRLKINKAIELMKSGKSVSEASELVGFSNANYFGVVFKREMGVSPGKYVRK